jgi:molybdopterin-guanine dinucleotide biosynthesis protein A
MGSRTGEDAGAARDGSVPEVSAIILAGGKSLRLALDKALLVVNGEWLLARIVSTLATLSDDLLVVANDAQHLDQLAARIVPDVYPGTGPLGGIYAGLRAMRYDRGLVVACDMPLLNLGLLRYLIQLSWESDVVLPRIGDKTEPLHAVYTKTCLRPIECSLKRGERRIVGFFPEVRVRYVEQEEVEVFDPQHLSFFNINTMEELALARRLSANGDWD